MFELVMIIVIGVWSIGFVVLLTINSGNFSKNLKKHGK